MVIRIKMSLKEKRTQELLLWAGVILFGIIYISLCFNYNLGVDEAYSIRTFNKDWGELIKRTAGDTHPPLYYFIARLSLLLFGESIPKFKLVPVAFGIATYALSIFYVRPRFGMQCAVFYQLFLFGIPYLTEYIIQIRMYAPVLFFVTWCALAAVEVYFTEKKKDWILLFLAALGACYTHNYGLLAAFVVYVILGIFLFLKNKKELLYWFISGVLIVLCFFPWMLILIHQMENMPEHFMAQPITGPLLLEILTELFACKAPFTTYMFWLLIVLAVVIMTVMIKKEKDKMAVAGLCMIAVFVFTFLLGVILSILITPLLMTRYMVSCLGVLSVGLAYGLSRFRKEILLALGVFLLATGIQSYQTNFEMEYLKHRSNATVAYFKEHLTDQDIILYNTEGMRWIYECYFPEEQLVFLKDCDFKGDYQTIYFMDGCCEPWLSDDLLTQNGWSKTYEGKYGMEFNDFLLYKLERK